MRQWTYARAAIAGALLALGCNGSDVCTSHKEPVLATDGGAFRCVVSEDCPRPSNVSVCLTNNTPEKACVTCTDTRCVETIPDSCD